MFNENSGLVKTWVDLINRGVYKESDTPAISNLIEVVRKVIKGGE